MDDDPREILVLLNSLGFIGITAQQLKAFMKDLKLYRKMKDRERQHRKEEMKRKIMDKQQSMIKEILSQQRTEYRLNENTLSTNSSSSYMDGSSVKVKVKCLSAEKENKGPVLLEKNYPNGMEKLDAARSLIKGRKILDHCSLKSSHIPCENTSREYSMKNRHRSPESLKTDCIENETKAKKECEKGQQKKVAHLESARPMSAPNVLEFPERIGSSQAKSTSSTRNTQSGTKSTKSTKSFIRPWRLQPDVQKTLNVRKSDPVALYQKYQEEWKQVSFPGEAKHAGIRWAIREKMLGGDPHPAPVPKKSNSMPTLKRK